MKLSKHLRIDDTLKFKKWHLSKIKKNRPAKGLFLLCTPIKEGELFEMMAAEFISERNQEVYVVAISRSEQWVKGEIVHLIDAMYNTKHLTYEEIKSE